MKKIFSLIAMCLVSLSMLAQTSTVATLTHNGVTTSYQGTYAFDFALRNAQNGDLITLSGGHFAQEKSELIIDKELTIRGNGMEGPDPTVIENDLSIKNNGNEKLNLNIEGIKFAYTVRVFNQSNRDIPYVVDGVTLKKCSINAITTRPYNDWYGTFKNLALINCKCNYVEVFNEASISIINSIILGRVVANNTPNFPNNVSITSDHSIFLMGGFYAKELIKGEYNNCIFAFKSASSTDDTIGNLVRLRNCLVTNYISYPGSLFGLCQSENCAYVRNAFKTCTKFNAITDDTYELTDEAKAYLSTDGETERGIYGGTVSYSPDVTYPRFRTFNVAEKADGGVLPISISIE